jgi:hypothetical protein
MEYIKPGSVVVIDNAGDGDTGSTGSNNSMLWTKQGPQVEYETLTRSSSSKSHCIWIYPKGAAASGLEEMR